MGKRNMKHRLEFWKYTIFEYEEATEHLNEMAARGWALREITLAWMPVACYEKDDGADGYTYTAEVMTELEDEDLLVLCQDAGWERILQLRNGRKHDRRHMVRHEPARLHGRRMDQTDLAKDCAGMGRHVPGRDGLLYGSQRFVADMKDIGGALWHVNS